MTITLSDIIALISLIIAIQGIFAACYLYFIEHKRENLKKDVESIKITSFLLKKMALNIVNSLSSIRSGMEFQNGIISRQLKGGVIDKLFLKNMDDILIEDWLIIEKNLQSMMIFTDDKSARESALKQLGEVFGDINTLHDLFELREHETVQIEDFDKAIDTLKKRLNTKRDI